MTATDNIAELLNPDKLYFIMFLRIVAGVLFYQNTGRFDFFSFPLNLLTFCDVKIANFNLFQLVVGFLKSSIKFIAGSVINYSQLIAKLFNN